MPDKRQHRGPHPQDRQLFAAECVPRLREAVRDLSWLLTRGYAGVSSLKLVGDRYALDARQRLAAARCACGEGQLARRRAHQVAGDALAGAEVWIDGYNLLTTIEAALSGGVVLHARDGCFRDMASMHGSYRKVAETLPAIQLVGGLLQEYGVGRCRWLLDQPVSNSGRLKTLLEETARQGGWGWEAELVADPDPLLKQCPGVVVSADSEVLNAANRWFNLARATIERRIGDAWVVDLSD